MKKLLSFIFLMLAMFIATGNVDAQTKLKDRVPVSLWDNDSVIATANSSYVVSDFDYNYTVQVDFDSIKGTIDGNLYWQASNDGVTWITLTTYALDGVTKDVFPFTSTSGAPYYAHRVRYVESTAASCSFRITLFNRKIVD